ncbi:MAG: YibE/F family protein [Candidatus Dojkabacteria bacterium]|uniref:YibE/F-like protein n=1 Tax=candidate division WS6 bacterium OLB21 TaxID=1617427 RepID=A0A136KKP8_9BACT|nr:MAG: YibE/F-like protein [candidate division WS6 bacterium OLB21]WKZ27828.1 MAG: YibE/F family protein [Candidatus Dojkabacteria bacterium]
MTSSQKLFSLQTIGLIVFVLIVILVSALGATYREQSQDIYSATVVRVLDLVQEGGIYYQNVEAKIDDSGKLISLRIQVRDLNLEEINSGDNIYVRDAQTSISDIYSFAGHRRSNILFWVSIVFFAVMSVILGKEGFKYIVPTMLTFLLVFSGILEALFSISNLYVIALLILGLLAFISMLIQVRNVRIAITVAISQMITLFLILLINVMLFKTTFMTELFYTNVTLISSQVRLIEFWNLINVAVLFIAFGATINTTLDVAQSIVKKKRTYPKTSTINLIREGTVHNQLAVGRVVNSFFFVFLGVTLSSIVLSSGSGLPFWEDPYVVQGVLWFMGASLAALLVGPITALITAISLSQGESPIQLALREGKN